MKWNKVAHRCPDTDRDVLIYSKDNKYMAIAKYNFTKKCFIDDDYSLYAQVTHWAERPKLPDF